MEALPRFSVAMCTFNGEKYLREQLESIAAQTVLPSELVVCDDGSTDGTVAKLESFQEKAPFPVHIHINDWNLGAARNFFKAARMTKSDWVIFCDQDDIWLPDRIAQMQMAIRRFPEAKVIQSDGVLIGRGMDKRRATLFAAYRLTAVETSAVNRGDAFKPLARHVFATGAGMMVCRSWFETIPEPAAGFLHDEWLAWFAGSLLRILELPTFQYRQHDSQQTGIDPSLTRHVAKALAGGGNRRQTLSQGIERYQVLQEMYNGWGQSKDNRIISTLTGKIEFLQQRQALAASGLPDRIAGIFKLMGLGLYGRFSSGWRTICKDMIGRGQL